MHIKQQTGKRKNILHTFDPSRAKTKTLATNSEKLDINMKLPVAVSYTYFSFCEECRSYVVEVRCHISKATHYEIQCKMYTYLNWDIDKPTTQQHLQIFTHLLLLVLLSVVTRFAVLWVLYIILGIFYIILCNFILFYVLFYIILCNVWVYMCTKHCHRVFTQLQLANISISNRRKVISYNLRNYNKIW
jgi:hypothetical protein